MNGQAESNGRLRQWWLVVVVLAFALAACGRPAGAPAAVASASLAATPNDPHASLGDVLGTPAPDSGMPVQACGVQGVIDMAFVIPPGARYDELVPGLAGATELEGKEGSLILFYDGPAVIKYLTGIPGTDRDRTQDDLVCVVTSDGEPNIYTDVGREGVVFPSGFGFVGPINDSTICEQLKEAPICAPRQ